MRQTDIGAETKVVSGIVPTYSDGTPITGAAIDRMGYDSCVLHVANGAATGSPTSYTVDGKLTHSATSGGSYTDVPGGAVTQITADNGDKYVDINLKSCKRYLKVVVDAGFTGGTTPKVAVAATLTLGGAVDTPAL